MTHAVIRYRLMPEHVAEHLRLRAAVVAELEATRPDGFSWRAYQLEDGVSFVEVVAFESGGTLSALDSWAAYRSTLAARCAEPFTFAEAELGVDYPAT